MGEVLGTCSGTKNASFHVEKGSLKGFIVVVFFLGGGGICAPFKPVFLVVIMY